jgi:YfiH family protein
MLKKPWSRRLIGDTPLYQASTMSWMPGVVQGFSSRRGGVSLEPYDTFNLSERVGDNLAAVGENRLRLAADLGFETGSFAFAEQVHGSGVARVDSAPADPVRDVDALVTSTPGILLTLFFADCVPVFVYDVPNRAVGLIHSGWRGTVKDIIKATLARMTAEYGTDPGACLAAIGPCICGDHFEVGREVVEQFRGALEVAATSVIVPKNEFTGVYLLNLRQVVFQQLLGAGVHADSIAVSDECTFKNKREFFSHRRESSRKRTTGRMAGVIGLRPRPRRSEPI